MAYHLKLEVKARIEKQNKMRELINLLPDNILEEITKDEPDMNKLKKKHHKILLDCAFIESEKENPTENEVKKSIGSVIIFCTLEEFRRKGLCFINKQGNYDKTDLGREVHKEMLNQQRKKNKDEKQENFQ